MRVPIRKKYSGCTTSNHIWLVSGICSGKWVCSVFYDKRKSFDTVPHRKLIEKLCLLDVSPFVLMQVDKKLSHRQTPKGCTSGRWIQHHPCHIQCASRVSPGTAVLPCLYWWSDKGSPLRGFRAGALCWRYATVQKDWLPWWLHNVAKGH